MNRRRRHPAAAAARRARFYRPCVSEEQRSDGESGAQRGGGSRQDVESGTPSSRDGALSQRVDGGAFPAVEEAA